MSDFNPYTVINRSGNSNWLLICEHASNNVPNYLNNLGIDDSLFKKHIAYDIGAYDITLALSKKIDATAIVCNYSRLVIDCNRPITSPECIPKVSDGNIIYGNRHLSLSDRDMRINKIYNPFHNCVFKLLSDKLVHNPDIKIANIHSFTPVLSIENILRPWDIGFIYRESYPSKNIIKNLKEKTRYVIGDNQPYNGFVHKGYTIPVHADINNIPSILVEFRQNYIADDEGVSHWSDIFSDAIRNIK